ncbi:hypothetical protein EYR38_001978 [Pleurotus pulmonarius]|nr:hypothetical protein EYR38_001978 [Pleurotus pulmonarius]
MEHLDLLGPLRTNYLSILGANVLDYVPQTAHGLMLFEGARIIMQAALLAVEESNEAQINEGNSMRLQIALRLACCLIYEIAEIRKLSGAAVDLNHVQSLLDALGIKSQQTLTAGIYRVVPDHCIALDMGGRRFHLVAVEEKGSRGLGIGGTIDFDTAQETGVPNQSTEHALKQVTLSDGKIGLLTGLQNGTWVYGHEQDASSGPEQRTLFSTKNLTPHGMPEVSRFKTLLEAEILCLLHAVQDTEQGKFLQSHVQLFPRSQVVSPWFCSLLNALLFMWMMVSVLCLRITGPSLLRTRRINLYLWTSDRSVHRLHAEHKTNSRWGVPLLLKTGQELGQGAHGVVKAIHGMDLVVKIGSGNVIRREAYFYQRARAYRGLPMVADFGAFDIDGSDGCALLLELARPVDDDSVHPYEVSKAQEDLATRLRIHHHDLCFANMVHAKSTPSMHIIIVLHQEDTVDVLHAAQADGAKHGVLQLPQENVFLDLADIILVVRAQYSATNVELICVILTPDDEDIVHMPSDVRHGELAIDHFGSVEPQT